MTSRSDSGVGGWGLTKMEFRTACGQGKWDREVETWEQGVCLPHLPPHEEQAVAQEQALEEVGTHVTPTQFPPQQQGQVGVKDGRQHSSRAHSVITDSWFLPPFLCPQVTLLLPALKLNSKPLLHPPGPSLPQTKPRAREGRHQQGHRGKGFLL